MFKELAKIESTFLGVEDHGIFTSILYVKYSDSVHQGIGTYSLDVWDEEKKRRVGTAYGLEFIKRTLQVCGVDSWEKLKGRTIYTLKESDRWGAKILGIESLPTEGNAVFIFDDLAEEFSLI